MKLAICSLLVAALLVQGDAYKFDSKKLDKKVEESANAEERKNEKRGATVVEIQAAESTYITPAPVVQVSHGPTIVPAVSVTPGILYAPQKQIVATASPSQVYAKPSPHLTKVTSVVSPAPANNLVVSQLHQQQVYQTVPKVSYNSPTYAITAPVAANLAYSKHQIIAQPQVYHHQPIPQVHYAAYSQPQSYYVHPQQVSYVQPQQVNYVQPHAQAQLVHSHPQVYHTQPQLFHPNPQVYHTQPQVYHTQPQVYHTQPQVIHAQPQHVQVYQHQPIAYHQPQVAAYSPVVVAQPVAKVAYSQPQVYHGQQFKGDAESYSSFAQSELAGVHYPNPLKVIPAPSLVAQAPVIAKQTYQPQYYHQPQQVQYQSYNSQYQHPQNYYSQHSPAFSPKIAYSQPQNNGYSSQYFGKNVQSNQNSYNSYSH